MGTPFDPQRAEEKLRREHSERAQAFRLRAERQQQARDRARRVEEEVARRREEARKRREERERALEEERSTNAGVLWHARLRAEPMAALSEGDLLRRRGKDKCQLPPSAKRDLLEEQGAQKNGPIFLSAKAPGTSECFHLGVLDFDAPEGVIRLPEDARSHLGGLRRSLQGGRDWEPYEGKEVEVNYRALPKGKYAKLRPFFSGFQEGVEDVKAALEQELERRSCLAVNEIVVLHDNRKLALQVESLQPADAVSLYDTDLEIDLGESKQQEEESRLARRATANANPFVHLGGSSDSNAASTGAADSFPQSQGAASESGASMSQQSQERPCERRRLRENLPPEPSRQEGISVMVRFPDGTRSMRAFSPDDRLSAVRDFAASVSPQGFVSRDFRLILAGEGREIAPSLAPEQSLREACLAASRQVALFYQPLD